MRTTREVQGLLFLLSLVCAIDINLGRVYGEAVRAGGKLNDLFSSTAGMNDCFAITYRCRKYMNRNRRETGGKEIDVGGFEFGFN